MGTTAAYIIAAACVGYFFCSFSYRFKYGMARKSGYFSYLHCTSIGLTFMLLSAAISWGDFRPAWMPEPNWAFNGQEPLASFGRDVVCAFLLATVAIILVNTVYSKVKAIESAWKDDLNKMLSTAIRLDLPVQITLENRKVYVGQVYDTLEPDNDSAFLSIIPLLGGYRDESNLEMILTHTYDQIVEAFSNRNKDSFDSFDNFCLVIPRDSIISAHVFNPDIYEQVSKEQSDN